MGVVRLPCEAGAGGESAQGVSCEDTLNLDAA